MGCGATSLAPVISLMPPMIGHPSRHDITHLGDAAPRHDEAGSRGTLAWVIFRRLGPLTLFPMTSRTVEREPQPAPENHTRADDTDPAGRENLALLGWGVVLTLLYPDIGLAGALLEIVGRAIS